MKVVSNILGTQHISTHLIFHPASHLSCYQAVHPMCYTTSHKTINKCLTQPFSNWPFTRLLALCIFISPIITWSYFSQPYLPSSCSTFQTFSYQTSQSTSSHSFSPKLRTSQNRFRHVSTGQENVQTWQEKVRKDELG